jgi:hypothetical protein
MADILRKGMLQVEILRELSTLQQSHLRKRIQIQEDWVQSHQEVLLDMVRDKILLRLLMTFLIGTRMRIFRRKMHCDNDVHNREQHVLLDWKRIILVVLWLSISFWYRLLLALWLELVTGYKVRKRSEVVLRRPGIMNKCRLSNVCTFESAIPCTY